MKYLRYVGGIFVVESVIIISTMQWARRQQGFTIVELLIVIVVIAILAAITIVSYNGITKKAAESVVQSGVKQVLTKIDVYHTGNGDVYPTSLSDLGIVSDDTTKYQYSTSTDGFCVTVTARDVSYHAAENFSYISGGTPQTLNQRIPAAGICPGHSANGELVIANLIYNPGNEVSTAGLAAPNSSTIARSTTRAHDGTASVLATIPANAGFSSSGVTIFNSPTFAQRGLEASTVYTATVWVYVPTGTPDIEISAQGGARDTSFTQSGNPKTTVKNQWVRLSSTFKTKPTDGSIVLYVVNDSLGAASQTQFWADSFMLVKGADTYNYADGSSAGWTWDGTTGLSSSRGPVL